MFVGGDFLNIALGWNPFDITDRIDSNPAHSTRWDELTNSKEARLFGSCSEGFHVGAMMPKTSSSGSWMAVTNAPMQNLILPEFRKR